MRRLNGLILVVIAFANRPVAAQHSDAPTFEVASVKPFTGPLGRNTAAMRGGPGTNSPERIDFVAVSARALLTKAYEVKPSQLSGPSWLDTVRFDISAKMPPGTSHEAFKQMLVSLLAARFGLAVHREEKDSPGYVLVVAKHGPHLPSPSPEASELVTSSAITGHDEIGYKGSGIRLDVNGYPEIDEAEANGRSALVTLNGRSRLLAKRESMQMLAARLESLLRLPVIDATGLSGVYSFTLYWTAPNAPPVPRQSKLATSSETDFDHGPTIFTAIQEQIGLRLDGRKTLVEVIVVDHMERTPTDN